MLPPLVPLQLKLSVVELVPGKVTVFESLNLLEIEDEQKLATALPTLCFNEAVPDTVYVPAGRLSKVNESEVVASPDCSSL